jgi:hypothetical protein
VDNKKRNIFVPFIKPTRYQAVQAAASIPVITQKGHQLNLILPFKRMGQLRYDYKISVTRLTSGKE